MTAQLCSEGGHFYSFWCALRWESRPSLWSALEFAEQQTSTKVNQFFMTPWSWACSSSHRAARWSPQPQPPPPPPPLPRPALPLPLPPPPLSKHLPPLSHLNTIFVLFRDRVTTCPSSGHNARPFKSPQFYFLLDYNVTICCCIIFSKNINNAIQKRSVLDSRSIDRNNEFACL